MIIVVLLIGCKKEIVEAKEQPAGLKISSPTLNDKGQVIHNIFNFDETEKTIKVTTVCYNEKRDVINDNDSYIMTLPGGTMQGWRPICPDKTADYQINITEVED